MRIDQVDDLIDRIQIHRTFFLDRKSESEKQSLKKEWYKVLMNYDYVDVNRSLDEFLEDPETFRITPTVYELVSHLQKVSDKEISMNARVRCFICNETIDIKKWDKHFDRCLSIDYLSRLAEHYSHKKLNRNSLEKMSDKEFEDLYWKCCEGILAKMPESISKHNLKNAVLTHKGKLPEYNLQELAKIMFPNNLRK